MKSKETERSLSDAEARELYHAWEERYSGALEDFVAKAGRGSASREELVDIVWEKGILDHVAPTNELERRAREQMKRDVYDRESEELFWRVMYSAGNIREASKTNASIVFGYAPGAVLKAALAVYANEALLKKLFPKFRSLEGRPDVLLADDIIERAKGELKKLGMEPHEDLIPVGAKGFIGDAPVEVAGYTPDGLVALRPLDILPESWERFWRAVKKLQGGKGSNPVSARHLDPRLFKAEN